MTQTQHRNRHLLAEAVATISSGGGQPRIYVNPADWLHFKVDFYSFIWRRKATWKERHQDVVGGIWDAVISRHSEVPRGQLVVTDYLAGTNPLPTNADTVVRLDTSEWGLRKQ